MSDNDINRFNFRSRWHRARDAMQLHSANRRSICTVWYPKRFPTSSDFLPRWPLGVRCPALTARTVAHLENGCRAICIIETDATIPHEIFSRMGGDTGDIDLVVHPERDCPLSSRLPRTWPHGALIIFSPSPWAEILQYSIQDAFLHSLDSVFACAHRNKGKIPVHTVSYLCPEGQYSVADRPRAHFYPGKSFESRNYPIAPIILNPYTRACIPASIKVLQ